MKAIVVGADLPVILEFLLSLRPHGCVAFLPLGPIILKSLRSKPYKESPKTLSEHLRKRRRELNLLQEDVAIRLRVSVWTLRNWENGRTTPGPIIYQRIVEFLGYYPHPTPRTLGHRLRKIRRCLGLTSWQAARLTEVDQHTFLMWECGRWTPTARTRAKVGRFLAENEPGLPDDQQPNPDAKYDEALPL